MNSIAIEQDIEQREESAAFAQATADYMDDVDNLDRLMTQSKSLVNFMVANDNMDGLKFQTISDLLWMLGDRLNDIEAAQAKLLRRFQQ